MEDEEDFDFEFEKNRRLKRIQRKNAKTRIKDSAGPTPDLPAAEAPRKRPRPRITYTDYLNTADLEDDEEDFYEDELFWN
jgi:hypothetical protein